MSSGRDKRWISELCRMREQVRGIGCAKRRKYQGDNRGYGRDEAAAPWHTTESGWRRGRKWTGRARGGELCLVQRSHRELASDQYCDRQPCEDHGHAYPAFVSY